MALNIERLTIKDTFTNWRDKINGVIDVVVLAPMADEDGVMHIDIPHCNAREVVFNVPVRMQSDVTAEDIRCTGSITSSKTVTTIQETADAGFKLTGTSDYIPWIAGQTQNGTASIYTSSYDDSLHFAYVNLDGELVNTFQWNPETNMITARIENAGKAELATMAESLLMTDMSEDALPGSFPMFFGPVDGNAGSGAWDNDLTYSPRTGVLTAPTFKGNLDGNAKTASSADKLSTARKLSLGTDATGYAMFDGSQDITIPCKLNATGVIAGLYGPPSNVNVPRTNRRFVVPSFRVDEKGRITQAFTRTVEFPYPEIDIDSELNTSSRNPVENKIIAEKIAAIDAILEVTPGMDTATPSSPGLMSAADKIKLNGLSQLPRIGSVSLQVYDAVNGSVATSEVRTLSTSKKSQLTLNAKKGIQGAMSVVDGIEYSEIAFDLSVNVTEIIGDGLIEANGKLCVPEYTGPTRAGTGRPGLVPPATSAQANLFLNGAGQWANPIGTTYNPATTSTAGLMSAADKTKLDAVAASATKVAFTRTLTSGSKIGTITINGTATDIYGEKNTDTTYSSFTGATSSAAGKTGLVPAPAKGAQGKYLRADATWQAVYDTSTMDTKLAAKANVNSPTLTGIPLADTAAAGTNTKQLATTAFVTTAINNLKGADCPASLDTLKEIATSLGNNTNFKKYVDDNLATKVSSTSENYIKNVTLSGRTLTITKGAGNPITYTTVDTDTKYSNFVKSGSTAAAGLVPKPPTTAGTSKYLCENGTWAQPAMNENTKVTNTLNKTAKAYITGTTSATTNTGTQVFDTGVFLTTTAGVLQASTFVGNLNGTAEKAKTLTPGRTINGVAFDGSKNITVADSTKLPLSGGTLTGPLALKTNSGNAIRFYDTGAAKGSAPSSNRYHYIEFFDNSGKRMGWFGTVYYTNKGTRVNLSARKSNAAGDTAEAGIGVHVDANGTSYGYAPTPAAGDNSTKIATTAWVNGNQLSKKVVKKGSKIKSDGDWTISNLTVGAPLYIIHYGQGGSDYGASCCIRIKSGTEYKSAGPGGFWLGHESYGNEGKFNTTNVMVVIPTATKVVLNVTYAKDDGDGLLAYQ